MSDSELVAAVGAARGEVGPRRVRIRQSALDGFLDAGSQPAASSEQPAPASEVDEGSITAWATFGAAMNEATSALENPALLADALDRLSDAAIRLAETLRPSQR